MYQDKKIRRTEYVSDTTVKATRLIDTYSFSSQLLENLTRILGIDAKLNLITKRIRYDYNKLPVNEIIRIVETDYRMYFGELCGKNLSKNNHYSMVCNVL
ncbi:hypothetical protein ACFC9N_17550 [Enterococcus casseliflavus]|uniref:DUF7006 family protein n=1 Tax=Enterococcus casseliflavus TaxID=37734 RepID=UPI0039A60761